MEEMDIRWIQRLQSFEKALSQLKDAVELNKRRDLSPLEEQGIIQAFEFTHELAWNVMKDYFDYQGGKSVITGSRDAIRESFQRGLITNGEIWMEMIRSRNQSSHTYNESTADEVRNKIVKDYFEQFVSFKNKMNQLKEYLL